MTNFNLFNKKACAALLVATTGLSTSMAAAQFQVEHSVKSESTPKKNVEHSVVVVKSNDNEHTFEVKIVDGEISIAKIDDEEISLDQVQINNDLVIFIDKNGDVVHELEFAQPSEFKGNKRGKMIWKSAEDDGTVHSGEREFIVHVGSSSAENLSTAIHQPKVMLGINLSEPSKALRKHLRIKDDVRPVLVEKVIDGLPAQAAGIQDFDVIVSIDGNDLTDENTLGKVLSTKEVGDSMKLVVLREGKKVKIEVQLAEYDPKTLGVITSITGFVPQTPQAEDEFEWEILTKIDKGEFGEFQEKHLQRLKKELHDHLSKASEHRKTAIEMRAKVMDAMKDVDRQVLVFRDGKLIVGSDQIEGITGEIHKSADGHKEFSLVPHVESIEQRLVDLEDRFDRQMDLMNSQMDRLSSMFERLMDKLEEDE